MVVLRKGTGNFFVLGKIVQRLHFIAEESLRSSMLLNIDRVELTNGSLDEGKESKEKDQGMERIGYACQSGWGGLNLGV